MHNIISIIQDSLTLKVILATTWTGVSFLGGAYVGYRFNLRRDYRKEFNDAAAPVSTQALKHAEELRKMNGYRIFVTTEQIETLLWHAPARKKEAIRSAWNKYKEYESKTGDEYWFDSSFSEWDEYAKAAEDLAKIISKK